MAGGLRCVRPVLPMIVATVRIVPRPGQEEHTLRAIRSVADSARALPGCVVGKILREVTPPWGLTYSETWQEEELLARHLTSSDYDLVLHLLEASVEPPTLSFRVVSELRDLSWVEQLRSRRTRSHTVASSTGRAKVVDIGRQDITNKSPSTRRKPPRKPPAGSR
jgi:quinol monooxygenase YgiN